MGSILDTQVGGDHYSKQAIQPIEYINANKLDFNHGNIVKYATREGLKGRDEDVKKIIDYSVFILKYDYKYTDDMIRDYLKHKYNT